MKFAVWGRLPFIVLGLMLLFVSERYLAAESYHNILNAIGISLAVASIGLTVWAALGAKAQGLREEAKSWNLAVAWQVAVVASIGLYFGYQKAVAANPTFDGLAGKALLGLWLLTFVLGFAAAIGVEWAMVSGGRGPLAESHRVARSGMAWLMVGMVLSFLTCFNYAGAKKDRAFDWSYLKTSTPGEATRKMVATLTKPMQISVFYPSGNEVKPFVAEYFDALAAAEPRIKVDYWDKDMHPVKAEELKIAMNGVVVLDVGGKKERMDIGLSLSVARSYLRNFDARFQKTFLGLTTAAKVAYFTRGHGEATYQTSASGDSRRALKGVEAFLREQNFQIRPLGMGEGSAKGIPDDAGLVIIAGPTEPFQPEEAAALKAYLDQGGKVLAFLEPPRSGSDALKSALGDKPDPLHELLAGAGIKFNPGPLANDRNFVAMTHTATDQWFLYTNAFTSHESVYSLAKHEERVVVLVFESGYLTVTPELGRWKSTETVRALPETFVDTKKNFTFDPTTGRRQSWVLGVAAEQKLDPSVKPKEPAKKPDDAAKPDEDPKAARLYVFANGMAMTDALIRNTGNQLLIADAIRWLTGRAKEAGDTVSEEDQKIQHTNKEDAVWFHGSVIGVPMLVLAAGFMATRRRKSAGSRG